MPYKPQGQPKPGKIGTITDPLMNKNIGIDNKVLMLIDDRLGMVQKMDLKVGQQVEYKQVSQGIDKGRINFIKLVEGSGTAIPAERMAAPIVSKAEPAAHTPPDTQDIQAEYVSKEKMAVTLKDCVGEEQTYRADLDVIKMLAKEDGPVKPGTKYKVRLVRQGDEWVVSRIGPFDETLGEKPFRTGKEILQQNLDQMQAEKTKAEAAMAQIKKEEEQAAARTKENEEYARSLVGATGAVKPMPATETPTEPEKSPQNESSTDIRPLKECPVEIKIHLDCGSYSNFDLTIPGLPVDQALAKIEQDGKKFIAVLHRLMAESKKGY